MTMLKALSSKSLLLLLTFTYLASANLKAQRAYKKEVEAFQEKLNSEYKDPDHSPLKEEDREQFTTHLFFPIDNKYKVTATLTKPMLPDTIELMTSSGEIKTYDKFAVAHFEIDGVKHSLTIYQSHQLRKMAEYKDYLFLPFKDFTNGKESYGGGRYIDLQIPQTSELVIDFNKSYNPLCAYSDSFSCPIPPDDNLLKTRIEAGIMLQKTEE